MKKLLLTLLCLTMSSTLFPQARETQESRRARRGEGSLYAYRDATTLSMVGWGFGIAIGIAAIAALIENDTSGGSSSSGGGGGTSH